MKIGKRNAPTACRRCKSSSLTWYCQPYNQSSVADGRLTMHNIDVRFFLGCDDCSETLMFVSGEAVADMMTDRLAGGE